jgi:hypothetical protein
MNGCMVNYSALAAVLVLAGAGLAAPAVAQPKPKPTLNLPPAYPNPVTQQAIAAARQTAPLPTFAQIPPIPKDVRSTAQWKASVTGLKAQGAQLTQLAASEPWTLGDTDAWAASKRAEAEPPAPVTTPSSQADTEAFAAAMRARAMPPPRKR